MRLISVSLLPLPPPPTVAPREAPLLFINTSKANATLSASILYVTPKTHTHMSQIERSFCDTYGRGHPYTLPIGQPLQIDVDTNIAHIFLAGVEVDCFSVEPYEYKLSQ